MRAALHTHICVLMKRLLKFFKRLLVILVVLWLLVFAAGCVVLRLPQFGQKPKGDHLEQLKLSKQHNGENFENAGGVAMTMTAGKFVRIIKAYMNQPDNKVPETLEVLNPNMADIRNASDTMVAITWYGHSAFFVEMDGKKILLDPMLGEHASPFSWSIKRFTKDLAIPIDSLPEIDAIILSHDHYDHLDYPTILKLKDRVGHFYVPLGIGSHLEHWGVEPEKITELDWWQNAMVDGIELICTPSQHFSGRGLNDRAATLWSSWVIKGKTKKLFFSGDSGYFPGFKEIGEKHGPFDLVLIECGQYNVNWQEIHMLPEESAQAAIDLRAKTAMPIHWAMFELSIHSWTEPVERVSVKAKELGLPITTPKIGERFSLDKPLPNTTWWRN